MPHRTRLRGEYQLLRGLSPMSPQCRRCGVTQDLPDTSHAQPALVDGPLMATVFSRGRQVESAWIGSNRRPVAENGCDVFDTPQPGTASCAALPREIPVLTQPDAIALPLIGPISITSIPREYQAMTSTRKLANKTGTSRRGFLQTAGTVAGAAAAVGPNF